ncbi:MAG: ATP phosphoribosyltransferase [Candidatus Levybacteria bacterium]|nr:ATP phosphoribosyltransferase [Candidatus Levybacteria bacterium]
MEREIRVGLPKGSLNTPGRANTNEVLTNAGYDIRGYEPGRESGRISIANDPEIRLFLIRPQSAPILLSREMLDIAITGEDWVQEEVVNGNQNGIHKIGDMEYGQTRLVIAIPTGSELKSLSDFFTSLRGREKPTLCFTEYLNLTRQKFMQNEIYQAIFGTEPPLVQIRGLIDGQNRLMQIIHSDGVTEGFVELGADIIADNTQSGNTLKSYGLREIEEIMKSSVGLYAGPSCAGWKERKAQEIFEQLYGAIVGRRFFDVKFNVPISDVEKLRRYLVEESLCADEPTITTGENFAQVNILIPRKTFPGILQTLRGSYNVSAIVRSEVKQYIE